jgi:nitrate/TMAO reductase-like tetraheme cytochrome c subunit
MWKNKKYMSLKILAIALGIGLLGIALSGLVRPAEAAVAFPPGQVIKRPALTAHQTVDNSTCLSCHSQPGMTTTLPNGEILSLTIDQSHFSTSVHQGLHCTDCHSNISAFPHPKLTAQSLRDFSMQMYTTCQQCHATQYNLTLDSVHQKALAAGNTNAAICTDCHNPHTQTQLTDPVTGKILPAARVLIPQVCARCHSAIYDQYKNSVHGSALIGSGNPDVPTCIDCHGVHNIQDPTTAAFRLNSPLLCSKCHTDASIMDKYGISTQVLNTYVADFHGTTVTLFEKISPDQATNKPVCFDCHGVHNIMRVDDPVYGLAMKQNLLKVCQRCHPNATANFPDAWMSHYIPSPSHDALVYYVNLFYKIFIPTVIGGMLIYVLSDIVRRLLERRKGAKQA